VKTFWTEATVNKNADKEKLRPQKWICWKRAEFELATGVQWSACSQHGGYQFHAVDDGVAEIASIEFADRIAGVYRDLPKDVTGYVTYMQVYEKMQSTMSVVMGVVKGMERSGMAVRTVDRMGKGFAFKVIGG
jgi:hypothetical protein